MVGHSDDSKQRGNSSWGIDFDILWENCHVIAPIHGNEASQRMKLTLIFIVRTHDYANWMSFNCSSKCFYGPKHSIVKHQSPHTRCGNGYAHAASNGKALCKLAFEPNRWCPACNTPIDIRKVYKMQNTIVNNNITIWYPKYSLCTTIAPKYDIKCT